MAAETNSVGTLGKLNEGGSVQEHPKVSYASVAATKSPIKGLFEDDQSQNLETLDKSTQQTESHVPHAGDTNIYGLWMIATDRRRRNIAASKRVHNKANAVERSGKAQGAIINDAYLTSNPPRKAKSRKCDGTRVDSVEVVSLNDGSISEMASRKVMSGSGSHLALAVSDKDNGRKHNGRAKVGGVRSVVIRGAKENISKGICVKKSADFRSPGKVVLAEWVQSATQRLESLANQDVQNGVHEALAMLEDDPRPLN
ncbi:hypothetical protein V6N13_142355 [Hibiscus sabdariffa]